MDRTEAMIEMPVRIDTILFMIFAVSVLIAVWVLDIVKDVQDLQTRVTQIEEVRNGIK